MMKRIPSSGAIVRSEREARARRFPPYVDMADVPAGWRLWGEAITIHRTMRERQKHTTSVGSTQKSEREKTVTVYDYTARAFLHDPSRPTEPMWSIDKISHTHTTQDPRRIWSFDGPGAMRWKVPRPADVATTVEKAQTEQRRREQATHARGDLGAELRAQEEKAKTERSGRLAAEAEDTAAIDAQLERSEDPTLGPKRAHARLSRTKVHIESAQSPAEVVEAVRMHEVTQMWGGEEGDPAAGKDRVTDRDVQAAIERRCREFLDLAVQALEHEVRQAPRIHGRIKAALEELERRLNTHAKWSDDTHAKELAVQRQWRTYVDTHEECLVGDFPPPPTGRPAPSERMVATRGTEQRLASSDRLV